MATYFVRADGSAGSLAAATGPAATAASCASWATFITGFSTLATGDTVIISTRGGVITPAASLTNTTKSGITFRGESGYRPTINLTSTYRLQCNGVSNCTFQNLIIKNAATSGIEFITSGTGHVVRDVIVDGSTNQAFQTEGTCSVTFYNIVGKNCTDDGFSVHDTASVTVYGGRFFGNSEGIAMVGTGGTRKFYDVQSFGNTTTDVGLALATNDDYSVEFYDSEFGCVATNTVNTTTIEAKFYRCKFKGSAVSAYAGLGNAVLECGNGNATRTATITLEACEFHQPPSTKHQFWLRGASSVLVAKNCTFAQATETGRGVWVIDNTSGHTIIDCAFYECTTGLDVDGSTITNCNFDGCTANISGTGNTETNTTTNASGFMNAAKHDLRLASGSALAGAGSGLVTFDRNHRLFASDVGAFSSGTGRRFVNSRRFR